MILSRRAWVAIAILAVVATIAAPQRSVGFADGIVYRFFWIALTAIVLKFSYRGLKRVRTRAGSAVFRFRY